MVLFECTMSQAARLRTQSSLGMVRSYGNPASFLWVYKLKIGHARTLKLTFGREDFMPGMRGAAMGALELLVWENRANLAALAMSWVRIAPPPPRLVPAPAFVEENRIIISS